MTRLTSRPGWIAAGICAALIVIPVLVSVQSGSASEFAAADWPFIGGNLANSRYSSLDEITAQTVATLGATWSIRFESGASTRAAPVVKGGVMYIGAGTRLYAIDAKTGMHIWVVQPDEDAPADLEAAGIGDLLNSGRGLPGPPGVALGEGMVFVGLMDGRVAAVQQQTGEFVWTTQLGYDPPKKGQAVSGAPVYADGKVFVGLANGDWAFRGKTAALDAKTGELLWEFYTIPAPGEPGSETWPQDGEWKDVWRQGGAGVWHVANVDSDLGLVYYVTGNAVPMFGGEARKGDNLYTASILAHDMETGELRWHYQVVHHDLWDADIAIAPLLFDTVIEGEQRKGLAALRADGYFFLMDRETGEPLYPVEERPVTQDPFNQTSPTQPFPVNADSIVGDCSSWQDQVAPPFVLDCSGFAPPFLDRHDVVGVGAPIPMVRVTAISYSPQTGLLYAQGRGGVGRARRITDDPWFRGSARAYTNLPESIGVLAAVDTRTNKVVWKKEIPSALLGGSGPLTTAGGLMFRGAGDGTFEVYNARTGDQLWQFQTGVPGARGPAITYEVDGEQHVAVAMGSELWAFKLGGTLPEKDAPPTGGRRSAGREVDEIMTSSLVRSPERGVGLRYAVDEHAFSPAHARVKLGSRLRFVNSGREAHTVTALDRSWSTGTLNMAESGSVRLDQPGAYTYHCENHPWAMGQITVEP